MHQAVIGHHADTRYTLTELAALALEIAQQEGLDVDQALDRAAEELDPLRYYVFDWDRTAFNAGNWTAAGSLPF